VLEFGQRRLGLGSSFSSRSALSRRKLVGIERASGIHNAMAEAFFRPFDPMHPDPMENDRYLTGIARRLATALSCQMHCPAPRGRWSGHGSYQRSIVSIERKVPPPDLVWAVDLDAETLLLSCRSADPSKVLSGRTARLSFYGE
jgi:hypothetical protein